MIEQQLLAAAVAHYRAAAGLTQQQAAKACGISTQAWWTLESGTGNPRLSTLVAVAFTLKVPLNALFCKLNPKSLQHEKV